MPAAKKPAYSAAIHLYVFAVAGLGVIAISTSLSDFLARGPEYRNQWLYLVGLTVLSGLLPVSLPAINVIISISETFAIAGTLLFGRSGGTILVLLDALFISVYLLISRGLRWQQVVFNLAAPPLSLWLAATVAGINPLFRTNPQFDAIFIIQLGVFTVLYYLANTWLMTFVLALQQNARPQELWWKHFKGVLVNYSAGASIAALLVYNTREVKPEFVFAIVPLLVVLYLTYRWSNRRIEVERERNAELNRVFLSTIEALALAIDAKDQVTHGHIRRVQRYTMALAEALGVKDDRQLDAIRAAALLHDTGKLAVPEYILNKPGPLTPAEFEKMKVHAAMGADILKFIEFPYPVEPIVRHHHENWDGSGYPDGLKQHQIPLGARLLSVVDCYDALTSDRPYRPRFTREHAARVLKERSGTYYDPWVVEGFISILDTLELMDENGDPVNMGGAVNTKQLETIAATTSEEREFSELRRELPRTATTELAAALLIRHLRMLVPAGNVAVLTPLPESSDLHVIACGGSAAMSLEGLRITIGERVSGWAFAHRQAVVNSNAALELGHSAREMSSPLRYAIAVPILQGQYGVLGVIAAYGSDPFSEEHKRLLEGGAMLFAESTASLNRRPQNQDWQPTAREDRVH